MPAVVTDQFRISNASNFIDSVLDSNNSYYVFLGLPNPTVVGFGRTSTWNNNTTNSIPSPVDNFEYSSHYKDTSLFGKKVSSANIRRVIKKYSWTANTRYDMYRHDYQVGINTAPNGNTGSLYKTNYYVMNSDYRVYVCLDNGAYGAKGSDTAKGTRSLDEPTFTDLEPAAAGIQDNYIWKYLFTVSPSDIIKFDSTEYIVLPNNWSTSTDSQIQNVRESGNSDINNNQIKKIYIESGGDNYGNEAATDYVVDILGDGTGGKVLISVDNNGVITDAKVTSGGFGYTYGMVDLSSFNTGALSNNTKAKLIPIIPPSKGHGYDIYSELGADKVLVYARFDDSTKDYPTDTHFAQVGILKNPTEFGSTGISTVNQYSSLYSLKLNNTINVDNLNNVIGVGITQLRSDGNLAKGYVASYDEDTKVLKYIQDRSLYFGNENDQTDNGNIGQSSKVLSFESTAAEIKSVAANASFSVSVDTNFSGITSSVGNKLINLGVNFTNGLANPEINKKTGDVIYIDNRKEVERDLRQKEDIKIILEF